jgi:hypothetical protein
MEFAGFALPRTRELAGRHYTTTLHSIWKIKEMRRSDCALDAAIRRLMEDVALHLAGSFVSIEGYRQYLIDSRNFLDCFRLSRPRPS